MPPGVLRAFCGRYQTGGHGRLRPARGPHLVRTLRSTRRGVSPRTPDETPSRRNLGRAMLSVGGVRLDSVLQWWRRLFGVFPACDSEPGSVSAPSLVTPTRCPVAGIAWFPFATMTCDPSQPAPPHTASVEQPVSQSSGSVRGACAPSRTRQTDYLAALAKLAGERFLATDACCYQLIIFCAASGYPNCR